MDAFWTKVLFKDFIKHFRKLTPDQLIQDIEDSMDALEDNNPNGTSFGALMVQWSNERMAKNHDKNLANGQKGGRPRSDGTKAQPKANKKFVQPSLQDLYDFANAQSLDEFYAREWFEMCTDRGWKDRDGVQIENWQGACKNYVKAKRGK